MSPTIAKTLAAALTAATALVGGALLAPASADAQVVVVPEPAPAGPAAHPGRHGHRHGQGGPRARGQRMEARMQGRLQHMSQRLGLSPAQQAQIRAIFQDAMQQRRALAERLRAQSPGPATTGDAGVAPAEGRGHGRHGMRGRFRGDPAMQQLRQATMQRVRAVLTPAQAQQLDTMRAHRQARRAQRGQGGHGHGGQGCEHGPGHGRGHGQGHGRGHGGPNR